MINLPARYDLLTTQERKAVRNEYVNRQNGKCSYCGNLLSGDPAHNVMEKAIDSKLFPKGFFIWPVHLHHDHTTSMTLGAVHSRCNAVLWQYHGE